MRRPAAELPRPLPLGNGTVEFTRAQRDPNVQRRLALLGMADAPPEASLAFFDQNRDGIVTVDEYRKTTGQR